jgi:hypothetical protein
MKKIICASILSSLGLAALALSADQAPPYQGSRFADVWETTQEGAYETLPFYKVTTASFFGFLQDRLQQAASRTLSNKNDVLPTFKKLLHANGVCLKGTWNITEPNPFSGYFREGTQGLIIARASAALSEVKSGQKRSLGLAGKIYPTNDESDTALLKTANFFVIDSLAGTYNPHFRDAAMTNDISDLNIGADNAPNLLVAAAAGRALSAAESAAGGKDAFVRQLYPISELSEQEGAEVITPKWIQIQGRPGPRTLISDFRDELNVENNNGSLIFDISVSSDGEKGKPKPFQKIGYIEFTESVASEGCDQRLHFTHPKWREDLVFKP